jgi:hypothetical protein
MKKKALGKSTAWGIVLGAKSISPKCP